ncbi:hypothetical protein ACH5RR_000285 [Cinchona calisaya]|uniref:Uncharacterized protein n=1 Tax=Cinchona calisaya TaxID=153742 RepID=A0ABD3B0D3_9GENT
MGGKGKKRREKNYRAVHGGPHSGLPPPPDRSSLDAVPSKLRKIMSFTGGSASNNGAEKNKGFSGNITQKSEFVQKLNSEEKLGSENTGVGKDSNDAMSNAKHAHLHDEVVHNSVHEKKKKRRKRKQVNDLRFETTEELGASGSKRKERKKHRLEERKKKRKRTREEENVDYRTHDEVKFGEVVDAPPKLLAVPKVFKITQDASQERLRLQAVEAYRNRKGWTSRPGVQLPPAAIVPELS